jgi:hypothetical protein
VVSNCVDQTGSYSNPAWIASLAWAKLTGVPSTFTPSAHASTHATAGTDPIAPSSIGAEATANKDAASGYAGLDGSGKLKTGEAPTWNQNTTGNAGTSTALAANGTNCSAGNYPLGVDASGNSEGCTAASSGPTLASFYTPQSGHYFYPMFQAIGLPDAATWTMQYQPGSATWSSAGGHGFTLYAPPTSADSLAVERDTTALGSSAFDLKAGLIGNQYLENNPDNHMGVGICITDGTKVVSYGSFSYFGGPAILLQDWSNATTETNEGTATSLAIPWMIWLRVTLASGTMSFSYSEDGGANYVVTATETLASFLSAGPLYACVVADSNANHHPAATTLVDWSH